jgi:hypothetical protein
MQEQAVQASTVFTNYDKSKMSHMLARLFLQFYVLQFCLSKFQDWRKEATKEKKMGETSSQWVYWQFYKMLI